MTPKISIIVPVYNVEKYIHCCVNSILEQSFKDFECILVDDCSPDNCPKICDEYKNIDNRIQVVHKKQNAGSPQARKTGFEVSKGNYILFIDSDDWIEPDMLEKMYEKAITNNYDIVISNCFHNYNNTQTNYKTPELQDKISILKYIIMYWHYSPSVCDKLVKRDIYEKIIFPTHQYIEDKVITIQTIYYSEKIGYLPVCLYHYRKNPDSICNSETQTNKTKDEYHNFVIILKFLDSKKLISKLEHELCFRINTIKLSFLKDKNLRNSFHVIADELYPESTENIFNRKMYMNFFNKIILFFAIKNNPVTFIIIDIYIFFENLIKKIYRFIVPINTRSMIGEKRKEISQNKQIGNIQAR
jgi:glycosyltransferase involved in cell wall biosynthesis